MPRKLLFVYNANSGLFNTVTDIAHKFLMYRKNKNLEEPVRVPEPTPYRS
uniref:Uncharacterized protein n=1 Tax=Candidatus Kentrum sp. TUN TaxID=2126343 RepID=A0A450ZMA7_9GAMM|nr:MAG: hypothetical protein BECKTUN1418F_GA0071002_10604 [Candidatus Kentron sp. TUN]VFK58790.1 MAG: hypothetical protein BECKTUN1418D_GA0071000_10903 [Candidatus Kentron sp. TUN]VFK60657.1 MAG: hypothetical protein BECKTUN1418E_GA0071001_10594 [Candidatus Kentron sp. TUN]